MIYSLSRWRRSSLRLALLLALLLILPLLAACTGLRPALSNEAAQAAWDLSAHADSASPSFARWGNSDPPAVPVNCAKCHSTPGYLDFHGADGSTPGVVDSPAPAGTTVECQACHSEKTDTLARATLPSGAELKGLWPNANCYECHQGRTAGSTVEQAIAGLELDTIDTDLSFSNIHNNAAGPIVQGGVGGAGYQYADREYASFFRHAPGFNGCSDCHDAHTLQLNPQQCRACHAQVRTVEDLRDVRVSNRDFDGDGNVREGIAAEIETLHDRLLQAMQHYAAELPDAAGFNYTSNSPFFVDDQGQSFAQWTPRLLRAAYNYRVVDISPGSYAHNPTYVLQLLYDSIDDLDGDLRRSERAPVPSR